MAKIKMKTKKAAAKRFSLTATGKVKIKRAGMRHNLGNKAANQKRGKRHADYLFDGDRRHVIKCLPNGSLK